VGLTLVIEFSKQYKMVRHDKNKVRIRQLKGGILYPIL